MKGTFLLKCAIMRCVKKVLFWLSLVQILGVDSKTERKRIVPKTPLALEYPWQPKNLINLVEEEHDTQNVFMPEAAVRERRAQNDDIEIQSGNGTASKGEDVDECRLNTHLCSKYAWCNNTIDSYECVCLDHFIGDGRNCRGNKILKEFHLML